MKIQDIKLKIGEQAKDIIVTDCGLEERGGKYSCPTTEHANDNCSCQWYAKDNKFFCHDCSKHFDIWDLAKTKTEPYEWLCETAGITIERKVFKTVNCVTKQTSQSGLDYIMGRGISKKAITDYRVRADDKLIYFNYATPDNKLVKVKMRGITEKKFMALPGGEEIFYGMHLLKNQTMLILCEGELDALAMYDICTIAGQQESILCSSLPNGASSLSEKCMNNCEQWLGRFDNIIIIPDNDEAGKEFENKAKEVFDNLSIIHLPDGVKDVNDFFINPDYNPVQIFDYMKTHVPELDGIYNSKDIEPETEVKNGMSTGYQTHDYNDNGLKYGCLTVITGATGEGKTSYSRQMLLAAAKQNIKSFMFVGETNVTKENERLARLCADKDMINTSIGVGGRTIYKLKREGYNNYNSNFADKILVTDYNTLKNGGNLFNKLKREMVKMIKHGVKLFILDNLMILCSESGSKLNTEQKEIAMWLKSFAETYNAHVILIAHQRGGDGVQRISGAQEIQNISDTILRYVRLFDDSKDKILTKCNVSQEVKDRASAVLIVEKIREDGTRITSFLEWDNSKGSLYDLSELPGALSYENDGYWTRSIARFSTDDQPRNHKALNANQTP